MNSQYVHTQTTLNVLLLTQTKTKSPKNSWKIDSKHWRFAKRKGQLCLCLSRVLKEDKEQLAGWKLKREAYKGKNGSWGMVQGYPQSTLLAVAASRTKDKGGPTLSSVPTLRYLPYTLFWDTIRSACGSNGSHVFYVRIRLSSQWESVSLLLSPFGASTFSSLFFSSHSLSVYPLHLRSVCCPPFVLPLSPFSIFSLRSFVSTFPRFRRPFLSSVCLFLFLFFAVS